MKSNNFSKFCPSFKYVPSPFHKLLQQFPTMNSKFIYILAVCLSCIVFTSSLTHQLREDFRMTWELEGDDTLVFELEVKTLGYIGFGFARSKPSLMDKADIIIGGVTDDTLVEYLRDRHGVGYSLPVEDSQQDYLYLESHQNDTHTRIKFSRLLNTCDPDDVEITPDSMNVIWSFGLTDALSYHSRNNRGEDLVNLLPGWTGTRRLCDSEPTTEGTETTEDSEITKGTQPTKEPVNTSSQPIDSTTESSTNITQSSSVVVLVLALAIRWLTFIIN